ncbi:MAG TPA: phasin family protein [Xanthobacteraceae bacterium]|nr:phasin family protein [Xanthobacteraceae bacterium]
MARDPMSSFEIPAEMRNMAEKSVEQAKKAFDGFIAAAQQAVAQVEGQAAAAQAGATDMRRKAMSFAEQNVATSFEFAQKLAQARNVEEVVRLQTEFVQAQMRTLAEQAKELGASAAATASDAAKRKA